MGANDLGIQGTWQWKTSGKAVNYTKYNAANPNDVVDESCIAMAGENGYWYNSWCAYEQKYHVCEKPKSPPPSTPSTIESMKRFMNAFVLIKCDYIFKSFAKLAS